MGLQAASGLTLLFTFLAYLVPIFGGWLADVKTGRFRAVVLGVIICGVAHIIQVVGAIPSVLQRGPANAAPPFIIGLLLLAVGAGIFKPNVPPLVLDQNRHQEAWVKTLKSGERVIVDPEATITRVMLIFYGFVNIGAFFMLATTYSEKYVGFWLSFLEVGVIFLLLPILLAVVYPRLYKAPAAGSSDISHAFRIIGIALRRNKFKIWKKGFWDAARPSVLAQSGIHVDWTDELVSDVRRTLVATEIFFYFPIWNLNDGGIGSVSTNQGASMTTNGAPNDLLSNFNPLTIIIAVPILSYVVYPGLERAGIKFGRISRITFGFFLAMLSGIIGAIIQWRVYKTSLQPSSCQASPIEPLSYSNRRKSDRSSYNKYPSTQPKVECLTRHKMSRLEAHPKLRRQSGHYDLQEAYYDDKQRLELEHYFGGDHSEKLILIFFGTVFAISAILIAISFVRPALQTDVWLTGGGVAVHGTRHAKAFGKKPSTDKDTRAGAKELDSETASSQETSGKTKTKEITDWMQQLMSKSRLNNEKNKKTTTITTAMHKSTSAAACGEQAGILRPQRSYISLSGTTLVASPSERSLASSNRISEELGLPN
ncbi:hypothetical protein DV737_g2927, partial [Chaetothyriales sp. CBS 132003]